MMCSIEGGKRRQRDRVNGLHVLAAALQPGNDAAVVLWQQGDAKASVGIQQGGPTMAEHGEGHSSAIGRDGLEEKRHRNDLHIKLVYIYIYSDGTSWTN